MPKRAVFSGTGGVFYLALLYKTEPLDVPMLLSTFLRDEPIAVLATSPLLMHQALLWQVKGEHVQFKFVAALQALADLDVVEHPRRQATAVLARIERVLSDENVRAFSKTMANVERASSELPATMSEARALD